MVLLIILLSTKLFFNNYIMKMVIKKEKIHAIKLLIGIDKRISIQK